MPTELEDMLAFEYFDRRSKTLRFALMGDS